MNTLRDEACSILAQLVNTPDADFHDGQFEAISALVEDRRRALVVQRTGWGKSAVYFISALLLRARGAGPTLIISPLLALMRDQVAAAERAGVRAAAINSANLTEWDAIQRQLANDELDVLLISPERLNNPAFREQQMPELMRSIGLLVIDEAHCISDWGHDFRPDYRRIRDLVQYLGQQNQSFPVLATTATANQRVVDDVVEQLGVSSSDEVFVLRGELSRSSLQLGVLRLASPAQRLGWLLTHLKDFPGSGIIYCLTVSTAQDTARTLNEAGYTVAAYTGATDTQQREELETALKNNEVKALVATSALGMGFDKPDLGFVLHLGAPSSPVAYYQQVGRAGRGTDHAEVLLLPGGEDRAIWQYFASATMPDERQATAVLNYLNSSGQPTSVATLETQVELSRSGLELLLKVLAVDGAVQRVRGGWQATGQDWHYDAERYQRVAENRVDEENLMLDYEHTRECRMQFLANVLDDTTAEPCGRCDNCAGQWYSTDISPDATGAAKSALSRVGVEIAPRKMWPSNMAALGVNVKGKIPPELQAEPGRAIARFTDLGWGQRLAGMLRDRDDTTQDVEVDNDLVKAIVEVLKEWDWALRPVGVVSVPSSRRSTLISSVAQAISHIGQLPYLGQLETSNISPSAGPGGNSAYRLSTVYGQFRVGEQLRAELQQVSGPVLLVDDVAASRWTITECTRVLREAGADAVLPFVLATPN